MNAERVRYYACPNPACPLGLNPAPLIEDLVWAAFVRDNPSAATVIDPQTRGSLIRTRVARIDLGDTVADITIHLADHPATVSAAPVADTCGRR